MTTKSNPKPAATQAGRPRRRAVVESARATNSTTKRGKVPDGERAVTVSLPAALWQRVKIEAAVSGEDAKDITAIALVHELDRRDREARA